MNNRPVGGPHKHRSVVVDIYDCDDEGRSAPQLRLALVFRYHSQVKTLRRQQRAT